MNYRSAAGFLAALACLTAFGAALILILNPASTWTGHKILELVLAGSGVLFGVITVNWTYPATGAVNPTAAQVQFQNEVKGTFTTDGALTSFTVTHNLNMSAADLALGFPDVDIEPASVHAGDGTGALFIASKTANTVVFTCAAVVFTVNIIVTRPNTLVR